jgi:hypothetical protein
MPFLAKSLEIKNESINPGIVARNTQIKFPLNILG